MVTVSDYKNYIKNNGFQEHPLYNDGTSLVSSFINFDESDLDLKIYINKLILCRSFYGTYISWYSDVKWFIENFFTKLVTDLPKPYLTETIRSAAKMINSDDPFKQGIISTTFLFTVIEFYAKYKLGFKPMEYNFFDYEGKRQYLKNLDVTNKKIDLSIKKSFILLQKKHFLISTCLNEIDEYTTARLSAAGIPSKKWTVHTIAERIDLARNAMIHGEIHSFFGMGEYLLLIYSLLHLCDLKELSI